MQKIDGENGNNAIEKRDGYVAHGNTSKLGNNQGDHKLVRLHFPDLPFAHQAHNDKKGGENNYGAYKNQSHTHILWKNARNILQTLAFYNGLRYNNGKVRVALTR